MHTVHKMNTLFNNQSYIDETENVFLGWEAIQGNEPLSVYHEMTFSFKIMEVIDALTNPIINAHMKKMFINGYSMRLALKKLKLSPILILIKKKKMLIDYFRCKK